MNAPEKYSAAKMSAGPERLEQLALTDPGNGPQDVAPDPVRPAADLVGAGIRTAKRALHTGRRSKT